MRLSVLRPLVLVCLTLGCGRLLPHGTPALARRYSKQEVLVPMRDGTRLFTVIYAPRNAHRPLPILLNRTPYSCLLYTSRCV